MKQDAKYFEFAMEDPSFSNETEGGYRISRRRHTRSSLRKTWKSGFTHLSTADKATLDSFYESVGGSADIFDWTNPENNTSYSVRFKDKPKWEYAGIGPLHRWNVSFYVEEA